uniref:Uncharacterized protein n=1 Tax=Peronospora matthiolae TaxID=2874970 RepID=A0AAV1VGT4_9STRA
MLLTPLLSTQRISTGSFEPPAIHVIMSGR